MKLVTSLLFWVWACSIIFAQDNQYYKVIAEKGDGIFSLLRKQGLDPVKHYKEFIDLNAETIKDGSFLQIGVAYKIPQAPDSFKKTGLVVKTDNNVDEPIFDEELAQMSLKSEKLKDAVYYLIVENQSNNEESFVNDIAKSLASELMVHGAKVYVMGDEVSKESGVDTTLTNSQKMGEYIQIINKRYIQNSGKYQRVLFIRANGVTGRNTMNVAVYHYNKSEQGQRFAQNIQNVFRENSISSKSFKDIDMIFEDRNSLYLAKNILPAISLLTLENATEISKQKINVRPDKKQLANILSNGIMNDYVDLEIEN